jgi:hypothetical protein
MDRRAAFGRSLARYITFLSLLMVVRLLFSSREQEDQAEAEIDSAAKPQQLEIAGDKYARYLADIDHSITRHSRLARWLRGRYVAFVSMSIITASAVPVVIAAHVPGWVAALLGSLAAVGQGIQQLLQDGRLATLHQLVARRLTSARRLLLIDLENVEEAVAFKSFVERAEAAMQLGDNSFDKFMDAPGKPESPPKQAAP